VRGRGDCVDRAVAAATTAVPRACADAAASAAICGNCSGGACKTSPRRPHRVSAESIRARFVSASLRPEAALTMKTSAASRSMVGDFGGFFEKESTWAGLGKRPTAGADNQRSGEVDKRLVNDIGDRI